MLCKQCGAQLPDGTEKCEFCGAELTEEQENEDINETEVPEEEEEVLDENELKRRAQMEKMMAEKQQQLSEIEKRRNTKKKRQKQIKIAIICAICAACIAVVGFGSYAVKENLKKPQPTLAPTAAPTLAAISAPTPLTTTPAPLGTLAPAQAAPASELNSSNAQPQSEIRVVNSANSASSGTTASGGTTASSGSSASSGTSSGTSASSSSANNASGGGSGSSASSVSSAKPSGISTANVSAQLTTGGEVIYNNSTGRYLMTFAAGGTLYYANVSAGSTTEQIKNKNITITAHPTEEEYGGNTVYEITSMTYYDKSDYIIPDSGTKLLTKADVSHLSKQQLALARNEIYARHGRRFQMEQFRNYFSQKSWYKENPNYNYEDEASNLNSIEAKNAVMILSVENSK